MSRYILNLILQGENQQLDFKHSITDSKKIARTLVAFANTDGGKLLVGVRDNGSIAGVQSEEEFYMVQAAADLYCKPPISFESKVWDIKGKSVLEITVKKNENNKLHEAPDKEGKYKVYIRVNDQNFIVNNIYLKAWNRKKFGRGVLIRYMKEEKLLLEYLAQNPSVTFNGFKRLAKVSRYKAEKILVNLIVLNLVEIVFGENNTEYKLVK